MSDLCLNIWFAVLTTLWRCFEGCYLSGFSPNHKGIDLISALICVIGLHVTEGLGAQEVRHNAIPSKQLPP